MDVVIWLRWGNHRTVEETGTVFETETGEHNFALFLLSWIYFFFSSFCPLFYGLVLSLLSSIHVFFSICFR